MYVIVYDSFMSYINTVIFNLNSKSSISLLLKYIN